MAGALLLILMIWGLAILRLKERAELEQEEEEAEEFDAELIRPDIVKLYGLSQEMKQVDEMLIDLNVCRPAEVEKYFRIDWMSAGGENHTLDFLADGENLTTEKLTEIAQERREMLNQEIADMICAIYDSTISMKECIGSEKNSEKNE